MTQLIIGHLGDAYGIKGWLHLISYADPPENIFTYQHWVIKKNLPIAIETYKPHGNHFVIKLQNCNDRDQALQFKHQDIFIDRSELPALKNNEYYWSDLIGITVTNQHNQILGVIDHLFETGSNDVIVITERLNRNTAHANDPALIKQHFIPYLKSVVKEIDLEKKIMRVNWEDLNGSDSNREA